MLVVKREMKGIEKSGSQWEMKLDALDSKCGVRKAGKAWQHVAHCRKELSKTVASYTRQTSMKPYLIEKLSLFASTKTPECELTCGKTADAQQ